MYVVDVIQFFVDIHVVFGVYQQTSMYSKICLEFLGSKFGLYKSDDIHQILPTDVEGRDRVLKYSY